MKKKANIRTVIRKIVREEVAMAIHEVITELKQPTQQVSQPQPTKKIVEKTNYTNNSILNDVLNETAQDESWKQMGNGTYDSSKVHDVMSSQYGDMMNSSTPQLNNGNLAAQMGVDPNNAPDFLTKDYRKLMKKVNEKNGRG